MRDLGGAYRRLQQQQLFNNSAALSADQLTDEQKSYFTFTFVSEPIHHTLDGWAFTRTGGPDGPFNASDPAWSAYRRDLAQAHKRSAEWLRSHLFYNPHLLPQASFLAPRARSAPRLDFVGDVGRFDREWEVLRAALRERGVSAVDSVSVGRYGARRSPEARRASLGHAIESATAFPAAAAAGRGGEALLGLCRVRYQEFVCLGFPLPLPCSAVEAQLRESAGWLF